MRKSRAKHGIKHMLPLERGLALAKRREGMTIEAIAEALCRAPNTLQRLFKRHGLDFKNKTGPKPK